MGDLTNDFSLHEFTVSASFPELAARILLTELDKFKLFYCAFMISVK